MNLKIFKILPITYNMICRLGGPMGSPLTVALAEVRVAEIETLAINSCQKPPKHYRHFVDDGFGQFTCKQHTDEFLQHLNSLTQDGRPTVYHRTSLYRRLPPIHRRTHPFRQINISIQKTNLYTNYSSAAPSSTKYSIISFLTKRAYTICSPKHLKPELEFLKQTFLRNGYPISRISLIMQRMAAKSVNLANLVRCTLEISAAH